MTREEKIKRAVDAAVEAQIRDDICARSAMYGLKQVFDWIPEDLITICKAILTGTDTPVVQAFLGRERAGMNYGHARMVYDRSWKYDEGEEAVDLSAI